ncbi:hypothetical protein EDC22_104152 [Tepidamorphus gemmatus]|jgi:uncharacterized protein|uniref:UrcA family protein n=1 Tax=Tepidamorphus gemmatus TaxID=747076 RepID=A0A4R3MI79_9HYPH|nr:hypothetical protein [Tepidamorphus gemmatus]TCT11395.1 hypothetical protein EDC22_104152 [Tepidamorphus gemmatus]
MLLRQFALATVLATAPLMFTSAGVRAQSAGDEPRYITGTIDCRVAIRPYESTVCSNGVLAAMDLQMQTLYQVVQQLVQPQVAAQLAAGQQAFFRVREACADDATCIGQSYASRIQEIDAVLQELIARGPY